MLIHRYITEEDLTLAFYCRLIELTLKIVNSPEIFEDDDVKYKKVIKSLKGLNKVSTAYLQRTLSIGYARSARLMERLEKDGFVGPANGIKPRKVLKK